MSGLYAACQFDFGENARMAFDEELVRSPNFIFPVAASAWVNSGSIDSGSSNCDGWTHTIEQGFVVRPQGDFDKEPCITPHAVACVVPQ